MKRVRFFSLFIFCLLCCSCGYQFCNKSIRTENATLSIPYIKGDQDGTLTAAVVREVVRSGSFRYRDTGGAFLLQVTLVDLDEKNIGFRYDRKKKGALTQEVIPTETRLTAVAEISLVESGSGAQVIAPVRLSASVDYDHDYYFSRNGVNIFSLGQLTDLDNAYDAAQPPLQQALAKKIAAYLTQSLYFY